MLDYGMQGNLIQSMKTLKRWKSTIFKNVYAIKKKIIIFNVENLEESVDNISNTLLQVQKKSLDS